MTGLETLAIRQRNHERKALKAAASDPPWHAAPCNVHPNSYLYGPAPPHRDPDPPGLMRAEPPVVMRPEDAAFVAAARNDNVEDDVDKLLSEIDRLRSLVLAQKDEIQP